MVIEPVHPIAEIMLLVLRVMRVRVLICVLLHAVLCVSTHGWWLLIMCSLGCI